MTLHLASPIVDDEPAAAPVLGKSSLDRRNIQRKCLRNWETVIHMLVDWKGKSMIMNLGPGYKPNPENYVRYGEPRLVEF
jgi:hypothetical protein